MITDEEMVFDALRRYAASRHKFAEDIRHKDFVKEDGEKPTKDEIATAISLAAQAQRLASYAQEKAESPIILMQ